jgi:hypothetical protein
MRFGRSEDMKRCRTAISTAISAVIVIGLLTACTGHTGIPAPPPPTGFAPDPVTVYTEAYAKAFYDLDTEAAAYNAEQLEALGILVDEAFKVRVYLNYVRKIEYVWQKEKRVLLGLPEDCVFMDHYEVLMFPDGNPMPVYDSYEEQLYEVNELYAIYVEGGD